MDLLTTDQILTVAVFLGLLVAVGVVVRARGGALRSRIHAGRRMQVIEVTAIGPGERAIMLRIDDRDYLVLSARRGVAQAIPLPKGPVPSAEAPQ